MGKALSFFIPSLKAPGDIVPINSSRSTINVLIEGLPPPLTRPPAANRQVQSNVETVSIRSLTALPAFGATIMLSRAGFIAFRLKAADILVSASAGSTCRLIPPRDTGHNLSLELTPI
jgi:hypothetical protein